MKIKKTIKLVICITAILLAAVAVFFILKSQKTLVTHPKGVIAHQELNLIKTNIFLMLIIIIPTFVLLFITLWKYRASNSKAKYKPDYKPHWFQELALWVIPSIIVAVMAVITLRATHELDPYKPLSSEVKPMTIQVVAMDWKWLFIYPEQQVASLNYVQFPEKTPIHFELSADGSPMNSFWIPQLSGQIYAMTGMVTQLHMMADEPGAFSGRAAEINGEGFADMTFIAQSSTESDFHKWITMVKGSPLHLTPSVYNDLIKPSKNIPITLYSHVEEDLFEKIMKKY